MADSVSKQVIQNGNNIYVAKFTNLGDGTGESGVVKLDPTSTGDMGVIIAGQTYYPGIHLKILRFNYTVTAMTLEMLWAATSNVDAWLLNGFGKEDFRAHGGLPVPAVAGATGQLLFTTRGAGAGSSYTVEFWCRKGIHQ